MIDGTVAGAIADAFGAAQACRPFANILQTVWKVVNSVVGVSDL